MERVARRTLRSRRVPLRRRDWAARAGDCLVTVSFSVFKSKTVLNCGQASSSISIRTGLLAPFGIFGIERRAGTTRGAKGGRAGNGFLASSSRATRLRAESLIGITSKLRQNRNLVEPCRAMSLHDCHDAGVESGRSGCWRYRGDRCCLDEQGQSGAKWSGTRPLSVEGSSMAS